MIFTARTRALEADDHRYLWHPFTQQREWERQTPVIIERGQGVYLQDIQGRWYLDGVSSIWVNLHGHQNPMLNRALKDQLGRIAHSTLLGLSNIPAIDLAKRLIAIAPRGLTRVFYSDNGSTAVEVALKIAFQFWQLKGGEFQNKTKFLHLGEAYHGDTLGAVSVGGISQFHARYKPLLFPTFEAHAPYCYRCPLGLTLPTCRLSCADTVEEVLKRYHQEIAGIIVEPMLLAAGGMITMPAGYLRRLRRMATRYGVLLIADEVATGFGRTGRMFACEHEGIRPDLMAISKGLTGGYLPLAATLATERIYRQFLGRYDEFKTFFHGHSYTGNPLGCAVALANLDVFERERTLEKLVPKIEALRRMLTPLLTHPHVGDVRQIGLIAAIELVRNRMTKEPYPLTDRMGTRVAMAARSAGLLLRPLGSVIVLIPPLSTTIKELRMMAQILTSAVKTATAGPSDTSTAKPNAAFSRRLMTR